MVKKNPDFRFNRKRKSGKTGFLDVHIKRELLSHIWAVLFVIFALFTAACAHAAFTAVCFVPQASKLQPWLTCQRESFKDFKPEGSVWKKSKFSWGITCNLNLQCFVPRPLGGLWPISPLQFFMLFMLISMVCCLFWNSEYSLSAYSKETSNIWETRCWPYSNFC